MKGSGAILICEYGKMGQVFWSMSLTEEKRHKVKLLLSTRTTKAQSCLGKWEGLIKQNNAPFIDNFSLLDLQGACTIKEIG